MADLFLNAVYQKNDQEIESLINKNVDIPLQSNGSNVNVIHLMFENGTLNLTNLNYILKKTNIKLVDGDLLCRFTLKRNKTFLNAILNFPFDFNFNRNMNILILLKHYKMKIPLSNNNIEKLMLYKSYIDVNEKNKKGEYPLLLAIQDEDDNDVIMSLINYADKNKFILDINSNDKYHLNPITYAFINNNLKGIFILEEYANKNNIILKINEKYRKSSYPLKIAVDRMNDDMVLFILNYSNKHNILLDKATFNELLLYSFEISYFNYFNLILPYIESHNIILNINIKNENNAYPLLLAVKANETEYVKLLIQYSLKHNMHLVIDASDVNEYCPLNTKNEEIKNALNSYKDKN